MQNFVKIDRHRHRVVIRAQGQWTMADADQYYDDMQTVLAWATGKKITFSLFADLDGLILHTAEVSKRIEESVLLMEAFPLDRYALYVPSYLMRMQCRRLLAGIDHTFFETKQDATQWLGWEPTYALAA
jgi:hypothetical protein